MILSPQLLPAALQKLKPVFCLLFIYIWSPIILFPAPWPCKNQIVLGNICPTDLLW